MDLEELFLAKNKPTIKKNRSCSFAGLTALQTP